MNNSPHSFLRSLATFLAPAVISLGTASSVVAQTAVWTSGASGDWGTAGNWNANAPVNSVTRELQFRGTTGTAITSNNNLTGLTVTRFGFEAADAVTNVFTFTGNGVNLSGNIANRSRAALQTFNINLNLTGTDQQFYTGEGSFTSDLLFGGVLSGGSSTSILRKTGIGNATFAGTTANTYAGTVSIESGILVLNKTAGVNAIAGNVTIGNSSGGLDVLRLDQSNQISDSSILTFNGTGTNAGVFRLNGNSELVRGIVSTANAGIIENGGAANSTLTVSPVVDSEFSGIMQDGGVGTFSLIKNGFLTLTLSGTAPNTHTGVTQINTGVLILNKTGVNAVGGDVTLGFGTNGTQDFLRLAQSNQIVDTSIITFIAADTEAGVFQLYGKNETIGGINSSAAGAGIIENGNTIGASALTIDNAADHTFSGLIRDNGDELSLTKNGIGVLVLSGANSYSGRTTVNNGVLRVGDAAALGLGGTALSNIVVNSPGRVELQGGVTVANESISITGNGGNPSSAGALRSVGTGTATWAGQVILGPASGSSDPSTQASRIGANVATLVISGDITDQGLGYDLGIRNVNTTDITRLSGTGNSYRNTYLVIGELEIGAVNALPTAGTLFLGNASGVVGTGTTKFDLNGFNQTLLGISELGTTGVTNTITNESGTLATLTINNSSGDSHTFGVSNSNNKITGNLALVKTGEGELTLAGNANTYSGGTTVNEGTLFAKNTTGSATGTGNVLVDAVGVLRGTGIITGNVSVQGTGTLFAGDVSVGTLTVGSLTFGSTARSEFRLGTASDLVIVNGDLALNGLLNVNAESGFSNTAPANPYTLFEFTGTRSGAADSSFLFGKAPAGYNLTVTTDTAAKKVFLVVDQEGLLYWDGSGMSADLVVNGGAGNWTTTSTDTNWTNQNGNFNVAWQNGLTAVFKDSNPSSPGGTVSLVDDVSIVGLQFGTNNYTVVDGGGSLDVTAAGAELRIDPTLTAMIEAPMTGLGGIRKTGDGVIILSGFNDYQGTTTVEAGTLQFNVNPALLNGGIVNNATLIFNAPTIASYAAELAGTGTYIKAGTENLNLLGATLSFSGSMVIQSGTLTAGSMPNGSLQVSGGAFNPGGTNVGVNVVLQNLGLNGGSLLWDIGNAAADTITVSSGLATLNAATLFAFNDAGFEDGTYSLIKGLAPTWNLNLLSYTGLDAGTFVLSGDGKELFFSTYSGGVVSGSLLQNSAPINIAPDADFMVLGVATTGTPTENNVINSLIFTPDSSLRVYNELSVTSGNFTVDMSKATLLGDNVVTPGDFTKLGAGTLNVEAAVLVNGNANVSEGALRVNGTFAASQLNVANGALLGGNGRISGDVFNNGVVAPGNSIGTLRVDGNYTQTTAGALEIKIAGRNEFDRLIVNGVAQLDGSLVVINDGPEFKYGDSFSFLEADEIRGGFDSISLGTTAVRGRFVNAGDTGSLVIAPASYTQMARTQNQRNVARALDEWIDESEGDAAQVTAALDQLSAEEYPQAFEAIAPGYYEGAVSTGIELSHNQGQLLHQQLSARRLGQRAGQNRDQLGERSYPEGTQYLGASNKGAKYVEPVSVAEDPRWSTWVQGSGLFSSGGLSLTPGESFESGTFMVGADYAVNDHFAVGFFAGYQEGWGDYDNGGSIDLESVRFGLYATVDFGGFYAHGAVGGGTNSYDVKRPIVFEGMDRSARGEPDGTEFFALLGTGYDFTMGNLTFGPQVSAQYTKIKFGTFSETGAGSLNLRVQDVEAESLRTYLGGRIAYNIRVNDTVSIIPELRVFWKHEFLNGSENLRTNLDAGSGPAFDYLSTEPERDTVYAGAGIGFQIGPRFYGNVYYNADFGRNSEEINHTVSVSGTWKF